MDSFDAYYVCEGYDLLPSRGLPDLRESPAHWREIFLAHRAEALPVFHEHHGRPCRAEELFDKPPARRNGSTHHP